MRVVVVGAGIVGAACAYFLSRDGHQVTVLDRQPPGSGTTSRGEGNILVSDKAPGPELDLALWSGRLWQEIGAGSDLHSSDVHSGDIHDDDIDGRGPGLDAEAIELEPKGGLVVARNAAALGALTSFAGRQREHGVIAENITADRLADYEPHLSPGHAGGVFYPQDQQVQPVLATARLLRAARRRGARVRTDCEVIGLRTGSSGITTVTTANADLPTDAVINAAGTWGGQLSGRFGAPVPVLPRRGLILVTEPLPRVVRHKVYSAEYVDNVASDDAALQTSVVVEGTRGGTLLIGASRERVGFDAPIDGQVVAVLAAQAVEMFGFLADVRLLRTYQGFRPYCPDHLPVIGADPRIPGLWHACGHEGAGIGLAPATGALITDLLTGRTPPIDPKPLSPSRFTRTDAVQDAG